MFGVTCRTAFKGGGCDVVLCSPVCVLPIIIEDMDGYLRLLDKQLEWCKYGDLFGMKNGNKFLEKIEIRETHRLVAWCGGKQQKTILKI